jgi:hypothetical protein
MEATKRRIDQSPAYKERVLFEKIDTLKRQLAAEQARAEELRRLCRTRAQDVAREQARAERAEAALDSMLEKLLLVLKTFEEQSSANK